jgi:hypothetical protein
LKVNEPVPGRERTYKGNRILESIAESLKTDEEKKLFVEMLGKCQKYALAINAKGKPFPTESMIMALLLEQHKMINWLQNKIHIPKHINNQNLTKKRGLIHS